MIATVFCSDCSKIALERDCPDSVLAIVTTMWEIFSDLSQNILDMGDWVSVVMIIQGSYVLVVFSRCNDVILGFCSLHDIRAARNF